MNDTNPRPSHLAWRFGPSGGTFSSQAELINYAHHGLLKMQSMNHGTHTTYKFYLPLMPGVAIASFNNWNDSPFRRERNVPVDVRTDRERAARR